LFVGGVVVVGGVVGVCWCLLVVFCGVGSVGSVGGGGVGGVVGVGVVNSFFFFVFVV